MDCDGVVGGMTWYEDLDGDGFGNPAVVSTDHGCVPPSTGYVANDGDCDDVQNHGEAINIGALEVCDLLDNDCDGAIDDSDPSVANQVLWSRDWDQDGFGDPGNQVTQCIAPAGYISDASDCHDFDAQTWPGANEYCDGVDDDCDRAVDDNAVDASTWYTDADGDGYGSATATTLSCSQPNGYAANADDCDDGDSAINPGTLWYADQDGDNYGDPNASSADCSAPTGYLADSTDCDDNNSGTYPGAPEACDAVDQDCDAAVDEEVADDGYEVAGVTPYNLGTLSGTKSVVGWFSSTDTAGEDWYTVTATAGRNDKTVVFSFSGPAGHTVTITDDDPQGAKTYSLSSGTQVRATVWATKTFTFTFQIVADPSLSDSDLCADPYTLSIQ